MRIIHKHVLYSNSLIKSLQLAMQLKSDQKNIFLFQKYEIMHLKLA